MMTGRELAFGLLAVVMAALNGCRAAHYASVPLERAEAVITMEEVPTDALVTLRAASAGRPFTAFEREDRGAYRAYEAEWQEDGVEAEATVLADGALLESERELTSEEFETLPPAVREKLGELRARGYRVEVARRTFYLFDIDASRSSTGDPEQTAARELLLRPDGTDATKPPRRR